MHYLTLFHFDQYKRNNRDKSCSTAAGQRVKLDDPDRACRLNLEILAARFLDEHTQGSSQSSNNNNNNNNYNNNNNNNNLQLDSPSIAHYIFP